MKSKISIGGLQSLIIFPHLLFVLLVAGNLMEYQNPFLQIKGIVIRQVYGNMRGTIFCCNRVMLFNIRPGRSQHDINAV